MFTLSENRWYNLKIADSVECPPVGRAYSCILLASEVNPAMVSTVRFMTEMSYMGPQMSKTAGCLIL